MSAAAGAGGLQPAPFPRAAGPGARLGDGAGDAVRVVERTALKEEIGSDRYFGGVLIERSGGLHPARYHRGLREAAARAGAVLCGHAGCRLSSAPRRASR